MEITYMRVVYSSFNDYHRHKNDEFLQNFEERSLTGIEGYGLSVTYSRKIDTAKLRAEMSKEGKSKYKGKGKKK